MVALYLLLLVLSELTTLWAAVLIELPRLWPLLDWRSCCVSLAKWLMLSSLQEDILSPIYRCVCNTGAFLTYLLLKLDLS